MRKSHLLITLLILIAGMVVFSLEQGPHRFSQGECQLCHYTDGSGKAIALRPDATLQCEGCHANLYDKGYMHPVNVLPRRVQVAIDFPLADDGTIACYTCHDIHAAPFNPFGLPTHLLRRPEEGKAFCAACHEDLFGGGTIKHSTMLNEAHFQSKYIATAAGQEIDPMSINCISCHDGSFGISVTITAGDWSHDTDFMGKNIGKSHPIGVDYEEARMKQGRKTDLRASAMLDPRLTLFDGKVGCGTCHNPYSDRHKQLVLSNEESRLCLACHMIDR